MGETVTLQPYWSRNDAVNLGSTSDDATDTLELSDAELDRITTDVLRIGNSNVGPITISDAVDPGGTDTLHLISGDAVSQSATVTVGNLAVEAGGGITLDMHPNEVDNLAMSAGTSGVQYRDATGFTVTTVDNVSGIHSASSIGLTAWTGDVTLVNTSAAEDLDAALGMYIRLRGNEALLKLESGANLRGDVNLIADKMDLAGTITAVGETVTLQPYWSRNDAVNLGSTSDDATDTLELSDAELDRITTDVLRIGNSNVGPITISDAVDPGGTDTLHLISGDAVSQSATVTVGNLAVEAGGGITLDMHPNEVDNLAMSAGTSGVQYRDATGFTVTTVDNVSGIHSASSIGLTAWTGDVTLVNTSAAEDLDAALGMYIRLRGNEALLKLESGANLRGDVNLIADKMDLAGTITAVGETVTLQPYWSRNDAVNLGSTSDDATDTLELSDAELDRITTDVLRIGNSNVGPITISDAVDPGGTDTLHLISGSGVGMNSYQGISVANLAVEADGLVNLSNNSQNYIGTVAITTSGVVFFTNDTGFTVGEVDDVAGIQGFGVLQALNGDVLISDTSHSDDIRPGSGSGTFQIMLLEDEAKLTLASGAHIVGGGQEYIADKMDLQGTITVPYQTVTLRPCETGEAIDLGSVTDLAADTLELSDAELDRITADVLRIGSLIDPDRNDAGSITITAPIDPANVPTLRLTTSGQVTQSTNDSLKMDNLAVVAKKSIVLEQLILKSAAYKVIDTGQLVSIKNKGSLEISTVDGLSGGTIDKGLTKITTESPLTIDQPVIDIGGGDIILTATNDGGEDDHLTINAPVQTTSNGNIELTAGTDLVINEGSTFSVVGTGTIQLTAERTTVLNAAARLTAESGEINFSTTNLIISGTTDVVLVPDTENGELEVVIDGISVGNFSIPADGQITAVEEEGTSEEPPQLTAEDVTGGEGTKIPLAISAELSTTDDSQNLSLTIAGIPYDAVLSSGTHYDDGNWVLSPAELAGLTVTAPDECEFSVTVTAFATNVSTGVTSAIVRSATVQILNADPVITSFSSDSPMCSGVVEGNEVTITASFTDGGIPDTHTAEIAWGDGQISSGNVDQATGTVTGSHVYDDGGFYTIALTLTDDDHDPAEGVSGITDATTMAVIVGAGVHDGVLQIIGTADGNNVTINMQDEATYKVIADFLPENKTIPAAGITSIHGWFCAGNDVVNTAGDITISVRLEGGDGDDKLKGGGGHDVLLGGEGDDLLVGRDGRDLLVGGLGADRLIGNPDDDILIAGILTFADMDSAIDAVMAEWTSGRDYQTRLNNLSGIGTGERANAEFFLIATGENATVIGDGSRDLLTGSQGCDWFFADLDGDVNDKITDLSDDEFAEDLDWILAP